MTVLAMDKINMNSRDTIIARLIKSNRRVDIGFEGTSHTYIGFLGSSNGVRSVIRAFVSGMYHGLALRSNWSHLGDIASIKNGRISRDIELECHAHVEEASGCVSLDRIVIQWSIKLTFSTYVRTYIVIRSILFLRDSGTRFLHSLISDQMCTNKQFYTHFNSSIVLATPYIIVWPLISLSETTR